MKESRRITPLRTILRNCLNHIENLETNPSNCDNYDKEFQDLKQFSETLKVQKEFACTEGEKEVNRKKNRYKDILPFNVSRVVLSEYAGVPGSDYINANFIKGASGSPAYIASQGPLPNTVNDFWRMVVECEVQVIVMACNAQESGKHKCENYWVEKEGEEKRFGMVQICLVKASIVCPDFLVRTMRLKYINDKDVTEERTVCQFHYSAWPDHGVPPLVRPLLDMVRLVRDTQASETLPVLVHCSAGCGRTGTICAIDFVWGLLRAGKLTEEFSLFNLVRDMRKQRVAMVQTKEQYILVHQAVRELFKEQLQVIESHPYENIDFNGVPLIKDLEEPFYDTICVQKEENCDEKQDKSEVKEKGEDGDVKINKGDTAPPLPRKKRPNVLFSKQEKEAENLTEKNRLSFAEKEKDKTDATFSSLLGKPRIVKLRALFEKSPNSKERSTLKDRGSQTVSRSHSLGAIRKPLPTELFESEMDKSTSSIPLQPSAPSDPVKLKHSKSFSKSVPLIKRSRSLKTFSQSPIMSVSPSTLSDRKSAELKNYPSKSQNADINTASDSTSRKPLVPSPTAPHTKPLSSPLEFAQLYKNCSIRRRSLESLMGDIPPTITWPVTVMEVEKDKQNMSPKLNYYAAQTNSKPQSLRQQLQCLNLERGKIMSNVASGIGTRERRNSFRQAVDKTDFQNVVRVTRETSINKEKIKNDTSFNPDKVNGPKFYESEPKMRPSSARVNLSVCDHKIQEHTSPLVDNSSSVVKNMSGKQSVRDNLTNLSDNATAQSKIRIPPVLNSKDNRSCDELDVNPKSKNLFLKKLNSEILSDCNTKVGESRPRSNYDTTGKPPSSFSPGQILTRDLKKHQQMPNMRLTPSYDDIDEPDGPRTRLVRPPKIENIDKVIPPWPSSNYQEQLYMQYPKAPNVVEEYKSHPAPSNLTFYKTDAVRKEIHQPVLREGSPRRKEIHVQDVRHKEPVYAFPTKKNLCFVPSTKVPNSRDSEASPSGSYPKVSAHANADMYSVAHPDYDKNVEKKFQLPSKSLPAEKNLKASLDCLHGGWHSHSASSRSSGEGTSSNHVSTMPDSLRLLPKYEPDSSGKSEARSFGKVDQSKRSLMVRLTESPKSCKSVDGGSTIPTNQRRPEETINSEFSNYGALTNSKLRENPRRYSKDDFLLEEPTAPPRVKRHASVTIPRSNLSNAEYVSNWAPSENKSVLDRNNIMQDDRTAWNDSLGVDLDAVAASMQQGESSVLKHSIWPGKNYGSGSGMSNSKKKQHYF